MSEFNPVHDAERLGGCIRDLLWMEAWARAASAPVKCANSLVFDTVTCDWYWNCIVWAHRRHVGILYVPKFSVHGQRSAARRVPEHTSR